MSLSAIRQQGTEDVMPTVNIGSLMIYHVRYPESFDGLFTGDDHDTGVRIGGDEWGELFFDILGCPPPGDLGDPSTDAQRRSAEVLRSLPRYPMLARISDIFEDSWYNPEEIAALRTECLQVRDEAAGGQTSKALRKLIAACDEALKERTGVYLACE